MKKKEFLKLLKKYNNHIASEEEKRLVEAYYALLGLNKDVDESILNDLLEDRILEKVWSQIQNEKNTQPSKTKKIVYLRRIAAAVIVLIIAGTTFYILNKKSGTPEGKIAAATSSTIITPAHKRAILTLSNGQNVALGSGKNKILSGGVKEDSGKIVYQNKRAEAAVRYNTLTTPRGGEFKVILSDGTQVWLNAGSSLRYPVAFNAEKRTVELKGEAYFEVAQQKDHPFIVRVGNSEVHVLGTHFNIRAYEEFGAIKTTLTEGKIRVVKDVESKLLKPGMQAIVSRTSSDEIHLTDANIDAVLAWRRNLFYFDNTNIKEIMSELSRWYDVDIAYSLKDLEDLNFSGVMSRYSDIDAVLKRLSLTGTVHFKIEGRMVAVEE